MTGGRQTAWPVLTPAGWWRRILPLLALLLAAAVWGLLHGAEAVPMAAAWSLIRGQAGDPIAALILWQIRLPRVCVAMLIGGALGISGAALQTLFRNPLAEPYLLGLSSGAAVGVYAAMFLGLQFSLLGLTGISLFALAGGLAAIGIVYAVARVEGRLPVVSLILAGVVVDAVLSALILFAASILETGRVMALTVWLLGRIERLDPLPLAVTAIYVLTGAALLTREAPRLNALVLGEDAAQALGIRVERLKRRVLLLTAALTAVAVAVSGLIGFIGLIVPHAARRLWGPDHRLALPGSFLLGAVVLVLADGIGRMLLRPAELPVGVVTAVCGGPLFLVLMRLRRIDA